MVGAALRRPILSRFLGVICGLLGLSVLASLSLRLGDAAWLSQRSEGSVHRDLHGRFGLTQEGGPSAEGRFNAGVFLLIGDRTQWVGTFTGGDDFVGTVYSTPFILEAGTLRIPILGYPNTARNHLGLEISTDNVHWRQVAAFTGANPKEAASYWVLDTTPWDQKIGRLVLIDGETTPGGWLGVGAPRAQAEAEWLSGVPRDYGRYLLAAMAVAGLLLLPGLSLVVWKDRSFDLKALAFVALPGLGLLTAGGLATWVLGRSVTGWILVPAFVACGLSGLWIGVRLWLRPIACDSLAVAALAAYGCVVFSAVLFGVAPVEVAGEFYAESTYQARMAYSPPDSDIPYFTAAYMLKRYDGKEHRVQYFGEQWSAASRGPLLPWTIVSLFVGWDVHLKDGLQDSLDHWPASLDGFYLARIVAVLTNGLVVFAGAWLASLLGAEAAAVALLWLCVCPEVLINEDFTWPKLLASAFVCLAVAAILRGERPWRIALWGALAYAAHPLGGLYMAPVGLFLFWRQGRADSAFNWARAFRSAVAMSALFILFVSPWIAYGRWVGLKDLFAQYPLGDGAGFLRAESIASWCKARWFNLWYTLVPGAFLASDRMRVWNGADVTGLLRWAVAYAKSLPGAVGNLGYLLVIASWMGKVRKQDAGFRCLLFLCGGLVLLLFWGFSNDGLGRNCLDPMAVLMIVYAASRLRLPKAAWLGIFAATAFESLSVRWIEVTGAPTYLPDLMAGEVLWLGAGSCLLLLLPLAIVGSHLGRERVREDS